MSEVTEVTLASNQLSGALPNQWSKLTSAVSM
jgi:hypothetical protein